MKSTFAAEQEALFEEAATSHEEVHAQIREVKYGIPEMPTDGLESRIETIANEVKNVSEHHANKLKGAMRLTHTKVRTSYRDFKGKAGNILRAAKKIDIHQTINLCALCIALETLMGTVVYVADGTFGPVMALGYNFTFATINVLLALLIGYLPIRWINIVYHETFNVKNVKIIAWIGLFISSAFLTLMVFTATRVRAINNAGENDFGFFDFSSVTIADTFDSGYALGILAISIIGAAIGILKGATGIEDFIVGFTARQDTVDAAALKGEDYASDAIKNVYDRIDAGIGAIEDVVIDPSELDRHRDDKNNCLAVVDRHNARMEIIERRLVCSKDHEEYVHATPSFVNTDLTYYKINKDAIEAELEIPSLTALREDLIALLNTAGEEAVANIRAALVDYLDADPSLTSKSNKSHNPKGD